MPELPQDENAPAGNPPSKSARKRQMLHLQAVGESLLALSDQQLSLIPIDNEQLLAAIRDCRSIRSNTARKRQLQFIGKLMRTVDPVPIEEALQSLHNARRRDTRAFQELEKLREDILAAGPGGVELATARFPAADRQQLRQLVLQHAREVERAAPPAASRKLFRYLRELQENQDLATPG
jgi:ribosome-associated protein